MNMFGFIQFNREIIAAGVAQKTGKTVKLARMNWHADSYHIYGKDIMTAKELLFDRIAESGLEHRTYNFNDDFIRGMYDSAENNIIEKIRQHDIAHSS